MLVGLHLLKNEFGWTVPVPRGSRRLPTVALRGNGEERGITEARDHGNVVPVSPVPREIGNIDQAALARHLEPGDRPAVQAGLAGLVGLVGLVLIRLSGRLLSRA